MTRIGILGVAHMHIDAYTENVRAAGAEIVGAYDWDGERGRAWCQRHNVRFFADISALLDAAPDGVIICSETSFHRQLAEHAARPASASCARSRWVSGGPTARPSSPPATGPASC